LHNLLNTKSQQEKAAKISPHYATQRCSVGWCRWCSYFATGATTFMAFGIENLHKFQRAVKPPPSREAVVFWQQSLHLIDTSWAPKRVEEGGQLRNVRPGDGVDVVDVILCCCLFAPSPMPPILFFVVTSNNNLIIDSLHKHTCRGSIPFHPLG